MSKLITLLLKIPRNSEITPEAAQTFLSALTNINYISRGFFNFSKVKSNPFSLEIVKANGLIQFQITCHEEYVPLIETQIHSNYPLTVIEKIEDPLAGKQEALNVVYLKIKEGNYYPLNTYPHYQDIDPLSSILSVLSKSGSDEIAIIQYALESVNESWQAQGKQFAEQGTKKEDGTYSAHKDSSVINEKVSFPGFMTTIRIGAQTPTILNELINSYGVFSRSDGNALSAVFLTEKKHKQEVTTLINRENSDKQILNIQELATLWHLPSTKIQIPSILWGKAVLSEAPVNLPIAIDKSPAEKSRINFIAKTTFQNREMVFGIKDVDRLRHIWVVGKTGVGKSTFIANMAIDDLKKDRGLGVIDPHGDLCEDILDYIPGNRINDTIYFDPADRDHPITINPLEVTNREEAELVVAGLMSIFTKVWANVWSARMEYILRNSFMTLTEIPNTTLGDVLKLLAVQSYRNKIVARLTDQTLVHFWKQEFDLMPEKLQKEAIAPIQNKVGQFVTSPMIRNIIDKPKSSISINNIMDEKKILLANLSQGRLGEDNSALLGAILITKFQLAAMDRVDIDKKERVPFHLYVDEFQNFATDSFIKILSEARKYGLALTLANQYMAQIPQDVQKAILGNAGTIISFSVGADDANILHKEFAEVFTNNDLVNLVNFQIAIKLMIDGHSTRPFVATTLPLPASSNSNKDKVLRVSRERWTKTASKGVVPSLADYPDERATPISPQDIPAILLDSPQSGLQIPQPVLHKPQTNQTTQPNLAAQPGVNMDPLASPYKQAFPEKPDKPNQASHDKNHWKGKSDKTKSQKPIQKNKGGQYKSKQDQKESLESFTSKPQTHGNKKNKRKNVARQSHRNTRSNTASPKPRHPVNQASPLSTPSLQNERIKRSPIQGEREMIEESTPEKASEYARKSSKTQTSPLKPLVPQNPQSIPQRYPVANQQQTLSSDSSLLQENPNPLTQGANPQRTPLQTNNPQYPIPRTPSQFPSAQRQIPKQLRQLPQLPNQARHIPPGMPMRPGARQHPPVRPAFQPNPEEEARKQAKLEADKQKLGSLQQELAGLKKPGQ